ncbi:MAG TPA: zf-HC2 domain-containing protein [Burkholderiales bacterium]|nr:zf-HC2 domain-containing protein [Burkholderiales bacterium]
MLTCRQVSELVSHAQDRQLGWFERWRMRVHLRVCEGCRNFERQISFMGRAMRRHPLLRDEDPDPPPD